MTHRGNSQCPRRRYAADQRRKESAMMPAARKPDPNPTTGLATLPRRNGLVIVGGKRPIGILIHEGDQIVQPELALWLDEASGFVFGSDVINPSGGADTSVRAALDALVEIVND